MHFSAVSADAMSPGNFTVSIVIIARNVEVRIVSCLTSVAWAHEAVVIDNGSTDRTKERALKADVRVISSNETDFAALRNIGLAQTKGDFIFYVDTDESVTNELRDEILNLVRSFHPERDAHVYTVRRKNIYLNHPWPKDEYLERLFWRPALITWRGVIHESPITKGPIGTLRSPLLHNAHRTLADMTVKTNSWSEREARLRLNAHHPRIVPWRLFRVMATGCMRSYFRERGILAGTVGLIESVFQAFSMFITYAKLFEMQEDVKRAGRKEIA